MDGEVTPLEDWCHPHRLTDLVEVLQPPRVPPLLLGLGAKRPDDPRLRQDLVGDLRPEGTGAPAQGRKRHRQERGAGMAKIIFELRLIFPRPLAVAVSPLG